jgi:hypothetical protein
MITALPDWADRVDNKFCGKIVPLCDFRTARFASAQRAAFFYKTRSSRVMNRAINSATAKQ